MQLEKCFIKKMAEIERKDRDIADSREKLVTLQTQLEQYEVSTLLQLLYII